MPPVIGAILGHLGQPVAPHDLSGAWAGDPLAALALAAAALAYGWGHLRRPGRARWRACCGGVALVALAVALVSPLDAMASALASAHMVQHVVLVLVAAPLLALAAPVATVLRGLPPTVARAVRRGERLLRLPAAGRALRQPAVAWLLHAGTLWLWHSAALYEAALRSPLVHALEHATFLGTGVLFWSVVLGGRRLDPGTAGRGILLVFTMALQSVLLAALLTFATSPWYPAYSRSTAAWGLDPLTDQQLAGVIMWVPAGFIYVGVGICLLAIWIRHSDAGTGQRTDVQVTALSPRQQACEAASHGL